MEINCLVDDFSKEFVLKHLYLKYLNNILVSSIILSSKDYKSYNLIIVYLTTAICINKYNKFCKVYT